jgi:hypothetical protein
MLVIGVFVRVGIVDIGVCIPLPKLLVMLLIFVIFVRLADDAISLRISSKSVSVSVSSSGSGWSKASRSMSDVSWR